MAVPKDKFDYRKHEFNKASVLKDTRNHFARFVEKCRNPLAATTIFMLSGFAIIAHPVFLYVADLLFFYNTLYFMWFFFLSPGIKMPFKMPKTAKRIDPNNKGAGGGGAKQAEGILYLGNEKYTNEEVWFTNSDARTHVLYLGTTGAGKTEGLKSLVANALGWGSGFIFIDGKADTDLWGSLSSLARRFGRDDDLLILNYMTGNSDGKVASNTINPFSHGSASYLSNLLVSLMPESGGDNAMWKDRAVALINALMPVLTWERTVQEKVLNISVLRESLNFKKIIERSRDTAVPEKLRKGLKGYLDTLPGYSDAGFNDDGTEKPNPSGPAMDYSTVYQQHGYLSMQFTRQLQSLADDYGYIFETPAADIDMMDLVLNRRLLVVLIPALEKSEDETANLGKIVGSMLKGMMGATLGSSVEGETNLVLENKPTRSSTPFMAVFDEVGYYTTKGMGVMAAQARSLGFCLVFAGQDLPAMKKRVKEEANSIVANCNIKIFGKLEDPTETKEFFEKTVGEYTVIESSSRKETKVLFGAKKLTDTDSFSVAKRSKANYDQLKAFKEGETVVCFGDRVVEARMFYSDVKKIKSLRVNKFISIPHPDPDNKRAGKEVDAILERVRDKTWAAKTAHAKTEKLPQLETLLAHLQTAAKNGRNAINAACYAMTRLADLPATPAPAATSPRPSAASAAPRPSVATAPTPAPKSPELTASDTATEETPIPTAEEARIAEKAANIGTAETVSWAALMGDDSDSTKETTPAPAAPAKTSATISKPEATPNRATPDTGETISWKDLMADDGETKKADKTTLPPVGQTSIGAGSFGVSSFGTGFGGLGGFGTGLPNSTTAAAPPAKPAVKKETNIQDALEKGETINWQDLAD